jgi:subtilisin family serine protease
VHLVAKTGERVELTPLPTHVAEAPRTHNLRVEVAEDRGRDPIATGALVARAARGFFQLGRRPTKTGHPAPAAGPPPVAFRDEAAGALRVVYREIVVRFAPETPDATRRRILGERGFAVRRRNDFARDQVVVYQPERRFAGEELLEIANAWTELDEVVFATPNFVSQYWRAALPRIPVAQWHLVNRGTGGARQDEDVDAREAWRHTRGKRSIAVAVLDDGVDVEHPNLRSRIWRNPDPGARDRFGRDFFVPRDDPGRFDPRPKIFRFPFDQMTGNDIHGTPCAGLIAAAGRDGGAVGIAPGCRVLPVKIFHADDLAPDEHVADAMRWAARRAAILSCSWSGGYSADLHQALEDVARGRGGRGTLVFCAAGNEDGAPVGHPARDANAIAVGASTDRGEVAAYSNVGKQIAFVAPSDGGVRAIYTTDVSYPRRGFNPGDAAAGGRDGLHTNEFGGTSSSTPLAAGIAALVLSVDPTLRASEARAVLEETCDKIGSGYDANGHSPALGHGRLNAGRAVAAAKERRARARR